MHQHAGGHTAGSSSNNNNSTSSSTPGGAGDGAGGSGSGSAAPGLEGLGVRPAERSAAQRYKDELHTLNVGGWGLWGGWAEVGVAGAAEVVGSGLTASSH